MLLTKRLCSHKEITYEKRERESLVIDQRSLKAPIQMDSTLVPSSKPWRFKFQVQKEEGPSVKLEEANQENDILLDLKEEEVE